MICGLLLHCQQLKSLPMLSDTTSHLDPLCRSEMPLIRTESHLRFHYPILNCSNLNCSLIDFVLLVAAKVASLSLILGISALPGDSRSFRKLFRALSLCPGLVAPGRVNSSYHPCYCSCPSSQCHPGAATDPLVRKRPLSDNRQPRPASLPWIHDFHLRFRRLLGKTSCASHSA